MLPVPELQIRGTKNPNFGKDAGGSNTQLHACKEDLHDIEGSTFTTGSISVYSEYMYCKYM